MPETIQDRLRQAADDNSDDPPIFGLYFEAAARIDELEQAAKARADSDAEEVRRRQQDADVRSSAWCRYVDLKRQIRLLEGDYIAQRPLVADALSLAKLHDFDIDREEHAALKQSVVDMQNRIAELEAERKAPALRITGTLITVGEIHVCEDYEADPAERLLTTVSGLLIKADDEALRTVSRLIHCHVDICPSQPEAAKSTAN